MSIIKCVCGDEDVLHEATPEGWLCYGDGGGKHEPNMCPCTAYQNAATEAEMKRAIATIHKQRKDNLDLHSR
jgi:hypothetical protein